MQERLLREQEYVNIELPSIIEWCLANTSKAFLPMPHRSWLHWDGLSIFFPQKVIYNFTGNKSLAWNRAAQTYPSLIDSRQGCELFFLRYQIEIIYLLMIFIIREMQEDSWSYTRLSIQTSLIWSHWKNRHGETDVWPEQYSRIQES